MPTGLAWVVLTFAVAGCSSVGNLSSSRPEAGGAFRSSSQLPNWDENSTDRGDLRQRLVDQPNDVESLVHLAERYYNDRLYRQSAQLFATARRSRPRSAVLATAEARAWLMAGEGPAALRAATRARKLAPESPEARYVLGAALKQVGRNDEAREELRAAWQASPRSLEAGFLLADWHLELGQADQAADVLDTLVALEPSQARFREALAEARTRQGRIPEAVAQLEQLMAQGNGSRRVERQLERLLLVSDPRSPTDGKTFSSPDTGYRWDHPLPRSAYRSLTSPARPGSP